MEPVVGRELELEAIASFLDGEPEGFRVLLLEGAAGIGKTTVWRAGVEFARRRGYRVLECSAAGSEMQLSLTALRDLVDDVFDEVADELPPPQRRAMAVSLLREEAPGRTPGPDAVAVGFLSLLRALAAQTPTLVAVDDVQWVDPASAAALGYALRRMGPEPLAAIVARRTGSDGPATPALEPFDRERLHVLPVEPLAAGALGRIIVNQLGVALPRPTLLRLHEVSGGNPFFVLELARALGDRRHALAPGEALPVPNTLHDLIQQRLAELPGATLEVLAVASALSQPTRASIEAGYGRDPLSALDPAIDARVVIVEEADLRFVHPLFAAGIYDLTTPARRREIHRRLSVAADDLEERARHLALATDHPDAGAAAVLQEAAERIRMRGDRLACAELFGAAARLTPKGDIEARARRLLAAATALGEAGDTEQAREMLEPLVKEMPEGPERVEARRQLGMILGDTSRYDEAMRLWREALEVSDDPAAIADVRRGMAIMALYGGTTADALQHADAAVAAAERSEDPERLAHALGTRALAGVAAGEATYRMFVERALALEPGLDAPPSIWSPTTVAAECARFALDLDEARGLSNVVLERAVEAGNIELEWWATFGSARVEFLSGNVSTARELSDVAFELAEAMGRWRLPATTLRAELDAFAGRTEEGVASLRGVLAEAERLGERRWLRQARLALGRIALAEGDAATAADELGAARRIADEMGMRHPSTILALADEAEAAEGAGRPEQAEGALAIARELGDPPSWAEQVFLRATAIRLAIRGELQEAGSLLERARDMGPSPSLPLQQARIFLALGSVERRLRKRRLARESLQRAAEMFDEIGAVRWSATARAELGRIGGRAPASGELTPAEERVAQLVAEGQTNREVAAALVISVHTVEAALTQVYRKLEVRSRSELVRRYADQPSKL